MPSPLIIAHRGASALAPENTLASFQRAIDDGADGIEFDVRLAKDGVPVIHHDASLRRTGRTDFMIADRTSTELGKTDVGSWFEESVNWMPRYSAEVVPTLAATFEKLRDFPGMLYVELKSDPGEDIGPLVKAVCDVIRNTPIAGRIIVKSFRLSFIPLLKTVCPDFRTAALFAPKVMTILRKEKYLVDLAVEFGADELSVHYSLATKKLMKKASKHGLPVTLWTVGHPRWLRRATKLGVNAVITNDPARLIAKRDQDLT
jgi:glycerophosphoryl diester phosphodiesterase